MNLIKAMIKRLQDVSYLLNIKVIEDVMTIQNEYKKKSKKKIGELICWLLLDSVIQEITPYTYLSKR